MGELRPGLWHWEGPHPDWKPGDSVVDFGRGLEIPAEWLRDGVTRDEIAAGLRPLLELPVELVLTAHGGPTDRAALERALS